MRVKIQIEGQRLDGSWSPGVLECGVSEAGDASVYDPHIVLDLPISDEALSVRVRALRIARELEGLVADLRVVCDETMTPEESARVLEKIEARVRR